MKVFVFGNGVSLGPTEGKLRVEKLTADLWAWLDQEGLRDAVERLQAWAIPQLVGLDPMAHQYDFELVAGSLYRLGRAIESLRALTDLDLEADALLAASTVLRRLYQRVVAHVLLRVDEAAWDRNQQVGLVEWANLDAMAEALRELHQAKGVVVYTLNYDSLLMSALLKGGLVYDGLRGLELNSPLDAWGSIALYPLHGSIGIYLDTNGRVRKRRLDEVRRDELLERWAAGTDNEEVPLVVLGDSKDMLILSEPFASYYNQLSYDLAKSAVSSVVVGGYGFGDRPLNRVLALFLAADQGNTVQDWRPRASHATDEVVKALQDCLPEAQRHQVSPNRILPFDITLPNADAVRSLL